MIGRLLYKLYKSKLETVTMDEPAKNLEDRAQCPVEDKGQDKIPLGQLRGCYWPGYQCPSQGPVFVPRSSEGSTINIPDKALLPDGSMYLCHLVKKASNRLAGDQPQESKATDRLLQMDEAVAMQTEVPSNYQAPSNCDICL